MPAAPDHATATALTLAADLPVAVIGAGPIGLAAAAHLQERGVPAVVLEAGDHPAAGVGTWGHVRLFSPWTSLVDPAAGRLLARDGWQAPTAGYPTGEEWRQRYLLPLAAALGDVVSTGHRVTAVTRAGHDLMRDEGRATAPFVLAVTGPAGPVRLRASAVIDASGTLGTPAPMGADGTPAQGEDAARAAGVLTTAIPDLPGDPGFAGRHVVVVGGGHSAMGALLGLATVAETDPATRITWVLRRPLDAVRFGGGTSDQLAQRGALGARVAAAVERGAITVRAPFPVAAIEPDGTQHRLVADDGQVLDGIDRVVVLTGFRPDLSLTAELRLDLDPSVQAPRALAPLIDPNVHSCGTVPSHGVAELRHPEPGLYTAGMKSYGRAPTFLALTGYEQVRSIVASLAGDHAAAAQVQLTLPESGVCGGTGLPDQEELVLVGEGSGGCC